MTSTALPRLRPDEISARPALSQAASLVAVRDYLFVEAPPGAAFVEGGVDVVDVLSEQPTINIPLIRPNNTTRVNFLFMGRIYHTPGQRQANLFSHNSLTQSLYSPGDNPCGAGELLRINTFPANTFPELKSTAPRTVSSR